MIFTLWKNHKKCQPQHPDFIVKDDEMKKVGIAYKNKTKKGVAYIRVKIEGEAG